MCLINFSNSLDNSSQSTLTEIGFTHWNEPNDTSNLTGFTALGSGYRMGDGSNQFANLKYISRMWSSTLFPGTTTTSLGLLVSIPENAKLIVTPVLKGFDVLNEMRNLLNDDVLFDSLSSKLIIWDNYHHGGYAKTSEELLTFIDAFHSMNDFQIEPVYTGKLFYALNDFLSKEIDFLVGKKVLALHTGGIIKNN